MAVQFVKATLNDPLSFVLAMLTIVVFAPFIEETLFRGFLQSYAKKYVGPKLGICIASACFSLFHYAAGQGLGNLAIIPPLFLLSLFLGFLYERQGSLFASMSLHALFNSISVLNLFFFGD